MKERLLIIGTLVLLVVVLIGLNAASYVQQDKMPDTESNPNRSTFNSGATGTRAFYDLLAESGKKPIRWQESTSALLGDRTDKPQIFVVIGAVRREFTETEIEQLRSWVSAGGKLVVIDREPPAELLKPAENWSIFSDSETEPAFLNINPSDANQMTEKVVAAKPTQPTVYTTSVNAVQPSRFAATITTSFAMSSDAIEIRRDELVNYDDEDAEIEKEDEAEIGSKNPVIGKFTTEKLPPPPAPPAPTLTVKDASKSVLISTNAPVVHLASERKSLLINYAYGAGEIVFLSDPFVVSNTGIGLVDNAQLAINLVSAKDAIIAFDEYHQGHGKGENGVLRYFEGTPLTAILWQIVALGGLILFSQSRRFARALPENEPNRLSKLEYVSAMAELQQRTRAFDLAIENIYTDFRRRVSRLIGTDNFTVKTDELARIIAERAKLNRAETEKTMFQCEEIIRGEPTNKREILELTNKLREIEEKLGLQRRRKSETRTK